ncbi:hypothetical protein [Xenorhabdus nematophila]|uniref:hypothetical protein n=1 Tax=Xenorhabdus nematophila TaxID=628 RepID=UPI000A3E0468|nr:hypothetical protein [Xenorhabdus nematophila]
MIKFLTKINIKIILVSLIPFNFHAYLNPNKIDVIHLQGLTLSKSNDDGMIATYKNWNLNKEDIYDIFKISYEYEHHPYNRFYQTPCNIEGKTQLQGEIWHFSINGGGIITFINDGKTIYLGCERFFFYF